MRLIVSVLDMRFSKVHFWTQGKCSRGIGFVQGRFAEELGQKHFQEIGLIPCKALRLGFLAVLRFMVFREYTRGQNFHVTGNLLIFLMLISTSAWTCLLPNAKSDAARHSKAKTHFPSGLQ